MSTTASSHAPPNDLETSHSYAPIPSGPAGDHHHRPKKVLAGAFFAVLTLLSLVFLFNQERRELHGGTDQAKPSSSSPARQVADPTSRGVAQGVSDKGYRRLAGGGGKLRFAWTKEMLTWQRTAYHFQPEKNWMNDPDGPLYYNGWYHLFYQYNPDSAVWGNITWAHAVSRDLVHWLHLPHAMVPDRWYDINGVWTGSATLLADGRIVMLYTGDTNHLVQVQCLAYPANLSDPLLLEWVKDPRNPVMTPPPGIGTKDFRDPTTAWLGPAGDTWLVTIGSKVGKTGVSLVYETKDFVGYEKMDGFLHRVPGTGMWECIDFYPVSLTGSDGLNTSANGPGVKHVMKASLDDDKNDYYAIGTYDPSGNEWVPDDPEMDVGIGLRCDYGKFYASKTFYDQSTSRRILWGWVRETDAEELDLLKGWSGVQSIPRTVVFDQETGSNIIQWPVEEVEGLRSSESIEYEDVELEPGSVVPLRVDSASQLDIMASFEFDESTIRVNTSSFEETNYDCTTSGGSVARGRLGPFGIIVLADESLSELMPIYFYVAGRANGKPEVHFCTDELRSSKAADVDKIIYGSKVPVLDGEKLTIRSLVDHSVVESFAQGGRNVITSRVYPTKAFGDGARIFLFNNATEARVVASVKIWKMDSADIRPFPSTRDRRRRIR